MGKRKQQRQDKIKRNVGDTFMMAWQVEGKVKDTESTLKKTQKQMKQTSETLDRVNTAGKVISGVLTVSCLALLYGLAKGNQDG